MRPPNDGPVPAEVTRDLDIPASARFVLERLRAGGFAAYAVGGCVRDRLLGREPGDWDVCTDALPEETERCFDGLRVIETGRRHGTVTVLAAGVPIEITTFRRDGVYQNHRSPEQVTFVTSLTEDLSRRDFTVNAMALGLNGVLHDPFGGQADLARRCIRCVGDPDTRFREDALRILRAMRFASKLEFSIHPDTAASMERNSALLRAVSGERIYRELTGLLTGPGCAGVLERFGPVLAAVLPEIAPCMGFDQHSPYHDRDVWAHTVQAVGLSQPDPLVRWTLLLHDLGKPDTFTLDERGVGHFYGHHLRSEALARDILSRLHVDNDTRDAICSLVRHHDAYAPPEKKTARRWLGRYGEAQFFRLMEVMRADTLAHVDTPNSRLRYQGILDFTALARRVLAEEDCFTLRDLAVNGRDVLSAGAAPGPAVGAVLNRLLEDVLEERCPNERDALLMRLAQILSEGDPLC